MKKGKFRGSFGVVSAGFGLVSAGFSGGVYHSIGECEKCDSGLLFKHGSKKRC
jgi:hypothetical protein